MNLHSWKTVCYIDILKVINYLTDASYDQLYFLTISYYINALIFAYNYILVCYKSLINCL